jgi:hypothetical protein
MAPDVTVSLTAPTELACSTLVRLNAVASFIPPMLCERLTNLSRLARPGYIICNIYKPGQVLRTAFL